MSSTIDEYVEVAGAMVFDSPFSVLLTIYDVVRLEVLQEMWQNLFTAKIRRSKLPRVPVRPSFPPYLADEYREGITTKMCHFICHTTAFTCLLITYTFIRQT